MKSIAVIGSLNIDHILKVDKLPLLGETISSLNYSLSEGGKGANQAAAIGKLGADVYMFGKVGNDEYSNLLISSLQNSNVNTEGVMIDSSSKTGAAFITVDNSGNNTIVITPGANGSLTFNDLEKMESKIFTHEIILLQMEIPEEIIVYIINKARKINKLLLLNLAPAKTIDIQVLNKLDYLIVNESEMEFLTNIKYTGNNLDIEIAKIRKFFHSKLVITLGPLGAAYSIKNQEFDIIPTFNVVSKDKTAAGDAFIGGFIFGLANGLNLKTCMNLENANGSLSTTILGAQKSLPDKSMLKEFLLKNGLKMKI